MQATCATGSQEMSSRALLDMSAGLCTVCVRRVKEVVNGKRHSRPINSAVACVLAASPRWITWNYYVNLYVFGHGNQSVADEKIRGPTEYKSQSFFEPGNVDC